MSWVDRCYIYIWGNGQPLGEMQDRHSNMEDASDVLCDYVAQEQQKKFSQ